MKERMIKNNPTFTKSKPSKKVIVANCQALSLRRKPNKEAILVGERIVSAGAVLEVITPGDEWSLIKSPKGTEAYVMNDYIEPEEGDGD